MKFTVVFVTLLSISTPWLVMGKKSDESKDKREAPVSYGSAGQSSSGYQTSQAYQPSQAYQQSQAYQPSQAYQTSQAYQPSQLYQSSQSYQPSQVYQAAQTYEPASAGHGDASAISVGAAYSIGGAKPSYSFGGQGGVASLQIPSDGLQSSGHNTIQLPPITLQPHGAGLVGTDLNQLMSQLSQSINSGALSLQPSNSIAEYHSGGEGAHGAQELAVPRYSYPKLQQYSLGGSLGVGSYAAGAPAFGAASSTFAAGSPIYASGSKGLSTYGSTGPVLFNPSENHSGASGLAYASPSSGHPLGDSSAVSLGGSGHALSGLTLDGSGHSFGSFKSLGVPSKSFTPSVFLGASSDSSHGLAGAGGSYNVPSFDSFSGGQGGLSLSSGAHGPSYAGSFSGFGGDSTKFAAPSFGSFKSEGYGSPLEAAAAFSGNGHLSSPPSTNYGFPSSSYQTGASQAASSASAAKPYYVSTSKHPSGGSSSYRGPSSSHSSLNSHSSGPKFSFGGHSSSRYSPKDAYGAHSETSYNTIKYSEELKPRSH